MLIIYKIGHAFKSLVWVWGVTITECKNLKDLLTVAAPKKFSRVSLRNLN